MTTARLLGARRAHSDAQHMTTDGPRPARHLGTQVGHVLADLPVFLTSPLFRRWHLRWGATSSELVAPMAGDDLLALADYRSTRAIEIDAAPDAVWPWLVQVGCLRAGWYSNDLLDNLARPSATTILPEFQHLAVGQWVPMAPSPPTDRTALKVHSFAVNSWLLWSKPDSTWSWQLIPTASGGTRLVTRIRATYDWRHPATAVLGVVLMELGDFAMLRRMLRGIKARAEDRGRSWLLAAPIGLAALAFSALYLLSDAVEVAQGGFTVGQLWLTLIAEAAIPIFVIGLAKAHGRRFGRLGWASAWAYAYSYAYFTGTVVYALAHDTQTYAQLSRQLGPAMLVHGTVMVVAGIGFGGAVLRARQLPAWTAAALIVGVVLVALTQGMPASAGLAAAALRDSAFAGMGFALLRSRR